MRHDKANSMLNEELLALLPFLDSEQQQRILAQWKLLNLTQRREAMRLLRPSRDLRIEPDFAALAKLANYFDCGVFDMVRYVRDNDATDDERPTTNDE